MQGKRFLTCSAIFQLPWNLLPKESQNSIRVPSYNLLVQQHGLNLQDGYLLQWFAQNHWTEQSYLFIFWQVSHNIYCSCVHLKAERRDEKTTASLLHWKNKIQSCKGRSWSSNTQAFIFTHHLRSVALLHFPSVLLWSLAKRWWRDQSRNSATAGRFASALLTQPCATLFDQVCPVHSSEKAAAT